MSVRVTSVSQLNQVARIHHNSVRSVVTRLQKTDSRQNAVILSRQTVSYSTVKRSTNQIGIALSTIAQTIEVRGRTVTSQQLNIFSVVNLTREFVSQVACDPLEVSQHLIGKTHITSDSLSVVRLKSESLVDLLLCRTFSYYTSGVSRRANVRELNGVTAHRTLTECIPYTEFALNFRKNRQISVINDTARGCHIRTLNLQVFNVEAARLTLNK